MSKSNVQTGSVADTGDDLRQQEQLLLSRGRDGADDALEVLWKLHYSAVVNAISVLARDEAEDIASEAFLATWNQLCAGGGPNHYFRAYVIQVAKNMAAQHFHRQIKVINGCEPDYLDMQAPPRESPESACIAAEQAATLNTILTQMPHRWHKVLHLQYVEQVPRSEIANQLDLGLNAVSALSRRARSGMRERWTDLHSSL